MQKRENRPGVSVDKTFQEVDGEILHNFPSSFLKIISGVFKFLFIHILVISLQKTALLYTFNNIKLQVMASHCE